MKKRDHSSFLFILLIYCLFNASLTVKGQHRTHDNEISSDKVPGYIKTEFVTIFDSAAHANWRDKLNAYGEWKYNNIQEAHWGYTNGRYSVNANDGHTIEMFSFDSLPVMQLDSNKVPFTVRHHLWSRFSYDNPHTIIWLVYPSKPGYYIANRAWAHSTVQLCYDSLGNIKYYLVLNPYPEPVPVSIPVTLLTMGEQLYPTIKNLVWYKGGCGWPNEKTDTLHGAYTVYIPNTKSRSKDTCRWLEYDSLGNLYRSEYMIDSIMDPSLPAPIYKYRHRDGLLNEYLDSKNVVQGYLLLYSKYPLFPLFHRHKFRKSLLCRISFDKNGNQIGKCDCGYFY
jgi:hypothetical protein